MGVIRKQTIKGSIVSYVGAILGMINTGFLFPRFFAQDEIGLINWLVPISTMIAQITSLGLPNVTARLFPYFRNENKNHNGFLFLLFWGGMFGFGLFLLAFFGIQPFTNLLFADKSPLIQDYFLYLLPMVFFTLFYNLFDGYNRVMYDAVSGTFFRDIVFKILNLSIIILFMIQWIDFSQFLLLYVIAYCLPTVLLFLLLWARKQISFKGDLKFITPDLRKSMASVSVYGIFNGLSDKLGSHIDKLMIVEYTSLAANGIYATMVNFGVLVSMPSRSLKKIASTVIAEAWKENDLDRIKQIYSQSGLHQFMLGALLFIGLWVNIDNVFFIVTQDFMAGKYVLFFMAFSHLIQMLSGVSGVVIQNSPAYKYQTYFMIFYGVMIIITNLIFIPIYGITGAALASCIASFLFNLLKYLFLLKQYRMQPFNYKFLLVVVVAIIAYISGYFLPRFEWFIVDILVRSSLVASVYLLLTYLLPISKDYKMYAKQIISKIIKKG